MSSGPDHDKLQNLRKRARRCTASVDLVRSPAELWPYLSNSNESNRLLGLPPVQYGFAPQKSGGTTMTVKLRMLGIPCEYIEIPFEWTAPTYFHVERLYTKGLFKYLKVSLQLAELSGGPTRVTVAIEYVPGFPLLPLAGGVKKQIRDFLNLYKRIDRRLGDPVSVSGMAGFETLGPESSNRERKAVQRKIQSLRDSWASLTEDLELPGKMAEYVHLAPEAAVKRIRPRIVARQFARPLDDVLRFMLQATRAGHLDMHWSVLCPGCKGPKLQAASLSGLQAQAHCESCNIDYTASFDKNVEVTFRPVPRVRTLDAPEFCFGSPSNTSQYWAQFPLVPGEKRRVSLKLPKGQYRWRTPSSSKEFPFKVDLSGGQPAVTAVLDEGLHVEIPETVGPTITLDVENRLPEPAVLRLERLKAHEEAVTAHYLTTFQDFRDLFGSQVLREGVELSISNVVLLFTDLKDSTALYEKQGDAPAFSLVQDHFDVMFAVIRKHHGSVVKTIGDAVMASFTTLSGCVAAASEILREFESWNESHPKDRHVLVKIGMHQGPCIAITQNDKLDYFGSTVNRAARVQGAAEASEMVLSESVFMDTEGQTALRAIPGGVKVQKYRADLKGIEGKAQLFKVTLEPLSRAQAPIEAKPVGPDPNVEEVRRNIHEAHPLVTAKERKSAKPAEPLRDHAWADAKLSALDAAAGKTAKKSAA